MHRTLQIRNAWPEAGMVNILWTCQDVPVHDGKLGLLFVVALEVHFNLLPVCLCFEV